MNPPELKTGDEHSYYKSGEHPVSGFVVTLKVMKTALDMTPAAARAYVENNGRPYKTHSRCNGTAVYLNAGADTLEIITNAKLLEVWIDWGVRVTAKVEPSKHWPNCYVITTSVPLLKAYTIGILNKKL